MFIVWILHANGALVQMGAKKRRWQKKKNKDMRSFFESSQNHKERKEVLRRWWKQAIQLGRTQDCC
jgi:hypothetical protein